MPAYNYNWQSRFQFALRTIASNYFERTALVLEPDEFIAAFIKPEHLPLMKEVQELVGVKCSTSTQTALTCSDGTRFLVSLTFQSNAPVLIPQYASHGVIDACPQEIREKLTTWADSRVTAGLAFGDAADALDYLSEHCAVKAAVLFMLPCLPAIAAAAGDPNNDKDSLTKHAKSLAQNNTRLPPLPVLPLAVKERLQDVSAFINAAVMTKDAPPVKLTKQTQAVVMLNQYRVLEYPATVRRTNLFLQNKDRIFL